MSTKLLTLDDLKDWDRYRTFMKDRLKRYEGEKAPVYVTKEPLEFQVNGKPWKGRALLLDDPQSIVLVKALKKSGVVCREGTVRREDGVLVVEGIDSKIVKSADKALQRLKIGCRARAEGDVLDAPEGGGAAAPGGAGNTLDDTLDAMGMGQKDVSAPVGWNDIAGAAIAGAEAEEEREAVSAEALKLWEELKAWVTGRTKDVLVKDPSLKSSVVPLIAQASKLGANMRIFEATELLRRVVNIFDGSAAAAPAARPEVYAEAHSYWQDVMNEFATEIVLLKDAIIEAFHESKDAGDPTASLARLDAVMINIELGLGSALNAASKAESPSERSKAYRDVQAKLVALKKRVDNDPLLREIAANPFTKPKIGKKLHDFLTEVGKQLRE